jgi:hypothetical protein
MKGLWRRDGRRKFPYCAQKRGVRYLMGWTALPPTCRLRACNWKESCDDYRDPRHRYCSNSPRRAEAQSDAQPAPHVDQSVHSRTSTGAFHLVAQVRSTHIRHQVKLRSPRTSWAKISRSPSAENGICASLERGFNRLDAVRQRSLIPPCGAGAVGLQPRRASHVSLCLSTLRTEVHFFYRLPTGVELTASLPRPRLSFGLRLAPAHDYLLLFDTLYFMAHAPAPYQTGSKTILE